MKEGLENKYNRVYKAVNAQQHYIQTKRWADIQARYDVGTDTDKKIIDFFIEDKATQITGWQVQYDVEHLMWVLDEMYNQVKQPQKPTATDLYGFVKIHTNGQVYIKKLMLGLLLIKCNKDGGVGQKYYDTLKAFLIKKADNEYFKRLIGLVFNTQLIFKSDNEVEYVNVSKMQEQVNKNTQDIDALNQKTQKTQETSQKTANVVLNGFNSKVEGYDILEKDIKQPEPKEVGFESLPIEVQSIILNGAIQLKIVKQEDEKLVWLLDGYNLGYFALKLSEIFSEVQQMTIYNIMYHYYNGELKTFSNAYAQYGKKMHQEPDEKIVDLLSVFPSFKK